MKKAINILSVLGIVLACVLCFTLFVRLDESGNDETHPTTSAPKAVAFADFPLDRSRFIDLEVDEDTWDQFTPRQKRDQIRDWLLFKVVSAAGLSVEEINQRLFDLPTIRYGYMRPVGDFEYGDARSRYIGNGQVVALLPVMALDERLDRLAHIADEHRKNLGEIPTVLLVFEYDINVDEQFATLTQRQAVPARELFTEENGYYETPVKRLDDLRRFMTKVQTTTFAQLSNDGLILGGRKLKSYKYRGIRVEDVAALWQAEKKIQEQLKALNAEWGAKEKAFLVAWNNKTRSYGDIYPAYKVYLSDMIKHVEEILISRDSWDKREEKIRQVIAGRGLNDFGRELLRQYTRERMSLLQHRDDEVRHRNLVDGSGFSLDPAYDYDALKLSFTEFESGFQFLASGEASAISTQDIEEARRGLAERNALHYLKLIDKLAKSTSGIGRTFGGLLLEHVKKKYLFQSARYDGDLQGTEVGMVLFYTDLLAKLWVLDFLGSTPSRYIEDFKAMTTVSVSSIYRQEAEELSRTRLWFGAQDKGFKVADDSKKLLFARIATRVYARSSEPFAPDNEKEANAASAAFLNWWDDHYEEIARYEPEYERLNEIMKWSLIIGWLNNAKKGQLLGLLQDVQVDRSAWFPEWAQNRPELRFQNWERIGFYQHGYKEIKTESIPTLFSEPFTRFGIHVWQLSGGVTLGKASTKRLSKETAAFSESIPGTTYAFHNLPGNSALVSYVVNEGTKLRSEAIQLTNAKFKRFVSRDGPDVWFVTSIGDIEVGRLNIAGMKNGSTISWRGRDMDAGGSQARRLSTSRAPERDLASASGVEMAIALPGNYRYLVRLYDTDRWLKIAPEEQPGIEIAEGWQARVADPEGGFRTMQLAWVNPTALKQELADGGSIIIKSRPGTGKTLPRYQPIRGPPTKTRAFEIKSGNLTLKGQADPQTGTFYFPTSDLPESIRNDPRGLLRLLERSDVQQYFRDNLTAQATGTLRYTILAAQDADDSHFVGALQNGSYGEAAQEIASNPQGLKASLNQRLTEQLEQYDRFLVEGSYDKALHHLDSLMEIYRGQPELQLLRAVVHIRRNKAQSTVQAFNAAHSGKLRDSKVVLDRINKTLKDPKLSQTKRHNLRRLAEAVDWRDVQAQHIVPEGEIRLVAEDDKLALHHHLDKAPTAGAIPPGRVNFNDAIYAEDSPEFKGLALVDLLKQTLPGPGPDTPPIVIYIERNDIAHFNPAVLYPPDASNRFVNVSQVRNIDLTTAPYRSYVSESAQGSGEDKKQVYLVRAPPPKTSTQR